MALPVTVPNTFAGATASIPLSQLDANFNSLSNAINGIANGVETLANVQVTGGNHLLTSQLACQTSLISNLDNATLLRRRQCDNNCRLSLRHICNAASPSGHLHVRNDTVIVSTLATLTQMYVYCWLVNGS
jgi:hypothetical protein